MNVLIFNSIFTAGGISKVVSDYVNNINDINVDLMTLNIVNDIYLDKKHNIYVVGKSKNIFKRIYNEYKIIKKGNYDVVHINGDFCSRIIECISSKLAGTKKIIIHSHSSSIGTSKKFKKIIHKNVKKLFNFLATDYLACSKEAAKWMFSNKIYINNNYKIINNGINSKLYKFSQSKRNSIRKKLNLTNEILIGFVGRFEYPKNVLYIAEILNECVKKNKNVKLLVIGSGSQKNIFIKKIKEYNLEENIIILDNINNVYDYYNAMDVLVLPSLFEGFPVVVVEAQASGLKVLMSNNITKSAKINNNIKYLDINEENIKKWVKEILTINNFKRSEGYKNINSNKFDILSVIEELDKIYKGVK